MSGWIFGARTATRPLIYLYFSQGAAGLSRRLETNGKKEQRQNIEAFGHTSCGRSSNWRTLIVCVLYRTERSLTRSAMRLDSGMNRVVQIVTAMSSYTRKMCPKENCTTSRRERGERLAFLTFRMISAQLCITAPRYDVLAHCTSPAVGRSGYSNSRWLRRTSDLAMTELCQKRR